MMTAYDPLDPAQRAILEKQVPGYTESKLDYFRECAAQKEFVAACSVKSSLSMDDMQRLVRLLGGSEAILVHPFDQGLAALMAGDAKDRKTLVKSVFDMFSGGDDGNSKNEYPGMFSFLTSSSRRAYNDPLSDLLAESRPIREFYAVQVIKHFPRYLTGHYSALTENEGSSRNKIADAAKKLVNRCEQVVATLRPLGEVANEMLFGTQPGIAASDHARRVTGGALNKAFNADTPGLTSGSSARYL